MIPKFRAWHKELKMMFEVLAIDLFNKVVTVKFDKEHYRFYSFDDVILMQFTGLKDKNGVEIFEGDVVNACGYDSDQGRIYKTTDFTGVIVYRKNSFCLQCGDFLDSWWANDEEVEVIAKAWLYGYTVQKEKLYTVEIPNPNAKGHNKIYLCKADNTGKVYLCKGNFNPHKNKNLRLTEAEIRKDFDWAWQWKKEVTE